MQINYTKNYIPNYPRPQLTRKEWINLNGEWCFGMGKFDKLSDCKQTINIPFAPECPLSGIGKIIDGEFVTYGRKISIKKKGRTLLHFEGVDYKASLFVNGALIAENVGAYHRFTADVTDYVYDGENEILLQVYDSLSREQVRGKQRWKNEVYACFYVQTTGIWKNVWMEQVSESYVADLQIVTHGNTVNFDITTVACDNCRLSVTVSHGKQVVEKVATVYGNITVLSLVVDTPFMWSSESPDLYDVEIVIERDGVVLDEVGSYFGFRDVKVSGKKLLINGKPEYLKMVLDQGYWLNGHLTPPSEQAIVDDVVTMKKLGLNGVRKHQKIEDDRFYYYCDIVGLYVWCEMPSMYTYTRQSGKDFLTEWKKVVAQHKSFPSVIVWVPFNESWGLNDEEVANNKEIQNFVNEVCQYTRKVDSRPVISNDGWEHTESDLLTIHQYEQNAEKFVKNYDFAQTVEGSPLNSRKPFCKGYKYSGQPILFTEFGGCSFKRDLTADAWGYGDAVENEQKFAERIDSLISAIESLDFCCGWCYTQLTDVQQEVNGLLRADRHLKLPIATFEKIIRKQDG